MKWFAILGLILFLGVAIAPSINAGVIEETQINRIKKEIENLNSTIEETIDLNELFELIVIIIQLILYPILLSTLTLGGMILLVFSTILIILEEFDVLPTIKSISFLLSMFGALLLLGSWFYLQGFDFGIFS